MVKNFAVFGLFTLINLLTAIIIGIFLDGYFGTKKTQTTNELPEDLGPQIKVDSLSAIYNPNPEESVEGYAAEGDINYTALSKSVDMTIRWFNYSGFTNVTELVIKRYIGDNVKTTKTLKKSISSESKYFKSFSGLLTYTFEGENVNYSVLGLNKIKIFYKNASNQEVELTPTDLDGVQIKKEDLTQTKELLAPIDVVYIPSTGGEITVSPEISRKGYFMYPGGSNLSIQEYIVSGTPHAKVYLVPSGTKNTTVKIKLENNKFIKYANKAFSFDQTTGTEFTLVKGETDGTIRLKIGETFASVKDGKLIMLKMSDITTEALYNTLDITFTETAAQKQDCVFEWEYGTINKSTGKRIKTYNIITNDAAGGTECLYDDGKTITEDVRVNCEGGWNNYGACSKTCGPGTKTRTWNATVTPKNNGTACPSPESVSCNLGSCKTCQSNGSYENYYKMYGFKGTYDGCKGITNETNCTNKQVDLGGYGYPSAVCKWK